MNIRLLGREDAELYWQCRLRALKEDLEAFGSSYEEARLTPMEQVRQRLESNPNKFTLGAWNEAEQLVGMVTFYRETLMKVKHKGNIVAMYVVPEERRKGIARQLLSEAISKAQNLDGLEHIILSVVAKNVGASQLYHSLGFETFAVEPRALKVNQEYVDQEWMVYYLDH